MSRRSRLATVVRVADLRESVARGAVASAGGALAQAVQNEQDRRDELAAATLDGRELHACAARLSRRAAAVTGAGVEVVRTRATRAEAVVALTEAARRATLLTQLSDRLRAEDEVRRLQADQRTADDSTVARHVRARHVRGGSA